jgi:cytochrome bd-type quinol oxidase subunit 2
MRAVRHVSPRCGSYLRRGATDCRAWLHRCGSEAQATPFLGAIGLFVLSYLGIAISLYPMIVPHHFTLWARASDSKSWC